MIENRVANSREIFKIKIAKKIVIKIEGAEYGKKGSDYENQP
jgi:hypothetical protein